MADYPHQPDCPSLVWICNGCHTLFLGAHPFPKDHFIGEKSVLVGVCTKCGLNCIDVESTSDA